MNSLFLAFLVLGSPCSEVEVRASVDEQAGLVRGAIRCHVASTGPVDLVSYQQALAEAEAGAIDDVRVAYTGEVSTPVGAGSGVLGGCGTSDASEFVDLRLMKDERGHEA